MAERVLIDTGPLVAILARRDEHHERCIQYTRTLRPPLVTTWPVLTEAAWLLRDVAGGFSRLLAMAADGTLQVADLDGRFFQWAAGYMARYRDLRPQIADVSLVYIAEQWGINTVFTLDRRDFGSFRLASGRPLTLVPD